MGLVAEFAAADVIAKMNELPRAVSVLDEVLSILKDSLPAVLETIDLPAVRTWDYAGVDLDEDKFPAVLVGGSIRTSPAGHAWMDMTMLAVSFAFPAPRISREDMRTSLDGVQAVRGLLSMPEVVGPRYADDGTTIIWNTLLPADQGFSLVPPNYPRFRGWQALFDVAQYPVSGSLWPDGTDE